MTITPQALWSWDTSPIASGFGPIVSGYPGQGGFQATKTGVTPEDLQAIVGVPLQFYGNPPTPVPSPTIYRWIRMAEDWVEQETSLLLCQTYVASPPALTPAVVQAIGINVSSGSNGIQQQGLDFDLEDAAYDFMFSRAQDEGWMAQTLRYRPVKSVLYSAQDFTAMKNVSYIYPLLNEFFQIPPNWFVEDRDYGFVRFVPAANVQMLPLFAMQLAFMGFAENVPGAIWFQYTAGLTPSDYQSRYAFIKRLVLMETACIALSAVQGTINLGAEKLDIMVDGLRQSIQYPKNGPFGPLIDRFEKQRDDLMKTARSKVSGPIMNVL